jgi:hypothetical protein
MRKEEFLQTLDSRYRRAQRCLALGHDDSERASVLLRQLREVAVSAGPSNEREEVAPGFWIEPGCIDCKYERLAAA